MATDCIEFLYLPWVITLIRILMIFVSGSLLAWSLKALFVRCKLAKADLTDWVISVVGLYWFAYSIYTLVVYDGSAVPPTSFFIFNMRFGLLLTLAAMTAVVKDRMFIIDVIKTFTDLNGDPKDEEEISEPKC